MLLGGHTGDLDGRAGCCGEEIVGLRVLGEGKNIVEMLV